MVCRSQILGRQSSLAERRSARVCTQLFVSRLGWGRRDVGAGPGANAEYGALQKTWARMQVTVSDSLCSLLRGPQL